MSSSKSCCGAVTFLQTYPTSLWRSRRNRSTILLIVSFTILFGLFSRFQTSRRTMLEDIHANEINAENLLERNGTSHGLYISEVFKNNSLLPLEDDLTVVTAFFNLGSYKKGPYQTYKVELFRDWMKIFSRLRNHLIVYVEGDEDIKLFTQLRSKFPSNRTLIVNTTRSSLWSFRLIPNISEIYKQPGYPKHHPNTVLPEYSSSMHAKFELVQLSVEQNPFHHKYFCWLDIGYFRDIINEKNATDFYLYLPPGFKEDSVAYNEVSPRNAKLSTKNIILSNNFWVGGGFFLARWNVMLEWVAEYKSCVERLIGERLMNTDQQVIYASFNNGSLKTKIQTYKSARAGQDWFYLGYLTKEVGRNRTLELKGA